VSGFAGSCFATEQFFDPSSFTFQRSILVLTRRHLRRYGLGLRVVLGAIVLQGLLYNLKDTVPANDRYIYFGAVIMPDDGVPAASLLPSERRSRSIALSKQDSGMLMPR